MNVAIEKNEGSASVNRLPARPLIGRVLWFFQALVILGLVSWLLLDGYLAKVHLVIRPSISVDQLPEKILSPRIVGLWTLCGVFIASWWAALLYFLLGYGKQFGIRPLFLLTSTMAGWLAILANWNAIVEAGRQWRLQSELQNLRAFASELNEHWNDIVHDRASNKLPQFNAYPIGSPTLLLFLGTQKVPGTQIEYCAIERSAANIVRIEMTGSNSDWWIEVRPDGTTPTQFIGGLNERYSQRKARRLGDHIYLVQYVVHEL